MREVIIWLQTRWSQVEVALAELKNAEDCHFKTAAIYGKGNLEDYCDILMSETSYYSAGVIFIQSIRWHGSRTNAEATVIGLELLKTA